MKHEFGLYNSRDFISTTAAHCKIYRLGWYKAEVPLELPETSLIQLVSTTLSETSFTFGDNSPFRNVSKKHFFYT